MSGIGNASADNTPAPDYSTLLATLKSPKWTQAQESTLLEPYTYLSSHSGKEIRTHLIDAFNLWLSVPEDALEIIRHVVRMLHNASLLMDDVEDDSELRRGLPVAHKIYGIPQTINTANYVYFQAFQELLKLDPKKDKGKGKEVDLVAGTAQSTPGTRAGPVLERQSDLPNGGGVCSHGLRKIAVKLMMAKSNSDHDYVPLVNLISVYFQIRDDYMNLQSTEYAENKGYCEDLTEGKFSFPVVHGVRADPTNRQILNVLQKRTNSAALKAHTVGYLRHTTKSFDYTRTVLEQLKKQIDEEVQRLGGNTVLERVLEKLGLPEGNETKDA
ncbi:geranylgeranyl diphosphate synthase, type III, partial [Tremellales sp. Uapishka_1]